MASAMESFCLEIIRRAEKGGVTSKVELGRLKLELGKKYGIPSVPSNPDILSHSKSVSAGMAQLFSIKPLRTLSGVAPVAVMTAPMRCPHGTCIYCPGGPDSFFGSVPQSYTGHEPATMRGMSNAYDAYLQTMNRLQQYYATGHFAEKIELIIMGGTFPSAPLHYQEGFVQGAFQAVNDFSKLFFRDNFDYALFYNFFSNKKFSSQEVSQKLLSIQRRSSIEEEQLGNESSRIRVVTLCIETKPDWCGQEQINSMLRFGTTRVELGAQSIYNEVLRYTNRGHSVEDTIEATRLLKDSGLKVTYHMMPGQPLSSRAKDVEMFHRLFEEQGFRPDALKIYPCMVMPGTALAKLYESGRFNPLTTAEAADIIAEAYRFIPEYVRVHRVQRDIPVKFALTGIDKNNLRQLVDEKMREKGVKPKDIRQRESGIASLRGASPDYSCVEVSERRYDASLGKEVFISYEDTKHDILIGYCRLRMPFRPFRQEFTPDTACIRELHVFGNQVRIGMREEKSQQHRGFGTRLIYRAEEIARSEFGAGKLLIISGVGAREYYRKKLGYEREGAYMAKKL